MIDLLKNGLYTQYFSDNIYLLIICFFAVFIFGYLLGSINFGIVISKVFFHDDIRLFGSKNPGANNMLRTFGTAPALATFLLDGIKAAVAVFIGALILGYDNGYAATYLGGLAAALGHAFPIFYKFKGGKSVVATFFIILSTKPLAALICLLAFIVIVAIFRYVSLGSILCAAIYPFVLLIFEGIGLHVLIAALLAALVVYLHRANIKRLMAGTESKLAVKSKAVAGQEQSEQEKSE